MSNLATKIQNYFLNKITGPRCFAPNTSQRLGRGDQGRGDRTNDPELGQVPVPMTLGLSLNSRPRRQGLGHHRHRRCRHRSDQGRAWGRDQDLGPVLGQA